MHQRTARSHAVENRGSFVTRLHTAQDVPVHLIKTYDHAQRPCWFLLKASLRELATLQHTQPDASVNLADYGEVVQSGWGHDPDLDGLGISSPRAG